MTDCPCPMMLLFAIAAFAEYRNILRENEYAASRFRMNTKPRLSCDTLNAEVLTLSSVMHQSFTCRSSSDARHSRPLHRVGLQQSGTDLECLSTTYN
eukprot:scaffold312_cov145-Skeletonema_menzelii.AAC.1